MAAKAKTWKFALAQLNKRRSTPDDFSCLGRGASRGGCGREANFFAVRQMRCDKVRDERRGQIINKKQVSANIVPYRSVDVALAKK